MSGAQSLESVWNLECDLESDESHTGPRVVESHAEVKQVIVHIVLLQVDSEPARAQQHQMQAGSLHFGKVQKT